MKNKTVKRVLCILLSIVTVFSVPAGALAAKLDYAPVIYIGDMSDNPLYYNPNKINATVAFDMNSSDFTGDIASVVTGVVLSSFADVATATPMVANAVKGMMNPILCAPDGSSRDSTIGPWKYDTPVSAWAEEEISENINALAMASQGYINKNEIFFFSYDWRLSPTATADELKDFIEHVENYTDSDKVSILSVGYGGVIANSYLYEYEDHAKKNVQSSVFYNCPILGNAIIGDFMKGRIARTVQDDGSIIDAIGTINGADRGEAFIDYISEDTSGFISGIFENLLGEGEITSLIGNLFVALVATIVKGEDGHKELGKMYNTFALVADDPIYDDFLREYLRDIPGLWALVPEKDFDAAMDFLYGDDVIGNVLNSKINSYRDVLENTDETLKTAQMNGINVCVVANYNLQILPVTISIADMSDGIESVKYASAGAVTADNESEGGKYNHCIFEHTHIAPDKNIDASYCYLPENTWFIRNLPHGDLTKEDVADFIVWLLFSFTQKTVWEDASYTQYMSYSGYTKKLTPYLSPENTNSGNKYGDIDSDGDVSAADARAALRMAVGLDVATKELRVIADVDGSNDVGAEDARLILRYSVGLIFAFPVEY